MTTKSLFQTPASRRRFLQGSMIAGAAAALSACGVGGGASSSDGSKTLTVLADPGGQPEMQPIVDLYKKEKGVTVNFITLPYDGVYTRYTSEFSSQNYSFDIAAMDAIWLPTFGGQLEPLDELYTSDVRKDMFPAVLEEASINSHMVGMPMWVNAQIVFYREDLFNDKKEQAAFKAKYGYDLAPPTDWQQWTDISAFFTRGTTLYGSDVKGNVETEFLSTALQAGAAGPVIDPSGNVILDNDAHLSALAFYADMNNKYHVAPPGPAQIGWADAQNLFNQGKTAMTKFWLHEYKQITSSMPVYGKVAPAPMISGSAGIASIPGDWHMTIPKGAPKADLAKEFIQFMYEHNQLALDTGLGLAARKSALQAQSAQKGYEALDQMVKSVGGAATKNRPKTPKWQQIVDDVLVPMVQKAVVPGADYAQLLQHGKSSVEQLIKS